MDGSALAELSKADEQGKFSQDCVQDRPELFDAEHDLFTAGGSSFYSTDEAGAAAQPTALLDGGRSLSSSHGFTDDGHGVVRLEAGVSLPHFAHVHPAHPSNRTRGGESCQILFCDDIPTPASTKSVAVDKQLVVGDKKKRRRREAMVAHSRISCKVR